MEVPILKQGAYLIASIQAALSDTDLLHFRDVLMKQVGQYRARGVIVDVAALDVMDSFGTRVLGDISRMISLRGAKTVIVGIQPEVAMAMVQMGLTLGAVETTLDLEEGLAYLEANTKAKPPASHE